MNSKICLGVTWLFLTSVLQISAVAQQLPSQEQLWQQDLQRQLPDTEFLELNTKSSSFTVLQREALSSFTKGTAILVPDWTEHPASPDYLDTLRQQLNDYGWHTLAILPPPPVEFNIEQNAISYQQQLAERMVAVITQAQKQGGNIIVIAKGSNAALLNRLYTSDQLPRPAALIMLGVYLADVQLNRELASHIATQSVPTLDIIHRRDNRFANANLKLRQQLVDRNLKAQYRQRQLSGTFYASDTDAWVLKEITGWLHSIGL